MRGSRTREHGAGDAVTPAAAAGADTMAPPAPPHSGTSRRAARRRSAEVASGVGEIEFGADVLVLRSRRRVYVGYLKPAIDVAVSVVGLIVLFPIGVVIALLLRATLGKGVFFKQQRIGKGGTPFTIYKFRTMRPDRRVRDAAVEHCRRVTHKPPFDPRTTRIGAVLRRSGLDELPQLWNVVKGDMSLVGPRPEMVAIVARYEHWQHLRHHVKPGITGLWQVSSRGREPMHECVERDIEYVTRVGFLLDLKILVMTPLSLLGVRYGA